MTTTTTDPIVFKCEDSLWQMLQDDSKTFDMRKWDLADERIYKLSWGRSQQVSAGRSLDVSFLNKATGDLLTFEYKRMEFESWAPGWCFLILGRRIGSTWLKQRHYG